MLTHKEFSRRGGKAGSIADKIKAGIASGKARRAKAKRKAAK